MQKNCCNLWYRVSAATKKVRWLNYPLFFCRVSNFIEFTELPFSLTRTKKREVRYRVALTRAFINSTVRSFTFYAERIHEFMMPVRATDIWYRCRYRDVDILSRARVAIYYQWRKKNWERPNFVHSNYIIFPTAHFGRFANYVSDDTIKSMKTFDSHRYKSRERLQMLLTP